MSEAELHASWLAELAAASEVVASGWYSPPPEGMSVLAGSPPGYSRNRFISLRDPDKWSRQDVFIHSETLLFLYCSPVHRATGMVGDFQVSLYRGGSAEMKRHLSTALDITVRTAEHAAPGMELRELFDFVERETQQHSVYNDTQSSTDASGGRNIGHTIPWFARGAPQDVLDALIAGNREHVAARVRTARIFLTGRERTRIGDGTAFTVEPQIMSTAGILASFHLLVTFEEGRKRILAGFSPVFERFGMTAFLPRDVIARISRYDSDLFRRR